MRCVLLALSMMAVSIAAQAKSTTKQPVVLNSTTTTVPVVVHPFQMSTTTTLPPLITTATTPLPTQEQPLNTTLEPAQAVAMALANASANMSTNISVIVVAPSTTPVTPTPQASTPVSETARPGSSTPWLTIILATLCSMVTVGGVVGIYCFVYRNTGFITEYDATIASELHRVEQHPRRSSSAALVDEIAENSIPIDPKSLGYIKPLGAGSHCEVWLAVWKPSPSVDTTAVAVKRLLPKRRSAAEVRIFLEDSRRHCLLKHPNIVALLGLSWHSKIHVEIVMEYMNGGNLQHLLAQSNPLSMGWIGTKHEIAMDVIDALAYLHHEQTVHQKITAESVLVHSGRRGISAKLSHCGSVRRPQIAPQKPSTLSLRLSSLTAISTSSPQAKLSQRRKWMAPEVLRGDEATIASDMYSFGVLLSTLDTHNDPYKREELDDAVILQRISFGAMRPMLSVLCPPLIHDIAQYCLASNPAERPTAAQVAAWLRAPGLCSPSYQSAIIGPRSIPSSSGLSSGTSTLGGSLPRLSMDR
ncbi:hypothetical protein LEN26_005729 [Aphanomyces euteiches]|nr:hypothetical protein LEN26_005729 [Aphanomyces euteiches]